jgi:cytochrome c peroxidase
MKRNVGLVFLFTFLVTLAFFYSCQQDGNKKGEPAIQQYLSVQTDALLLQLDTLATAVVQKKPLPYLQQVFMQCRRLYKSTEAVVEYYFQGLTKRINGPALPDVKTEDGQVWPPHGLQMIEQYLYGGYSDTTAALLGNEIKLLQTDLRFVKANMAYNSISPAHLHEIVQHQLIRIAALGITGADAPLSKQSITEAAWSLEGLRQLLQQYGSKIPPLLDTCVHRLYSNPSFDGFDRMAFLQQYLMPLSMVLDTLLAYPAGSDSLMVKPFRGTLASLMQGKGFVPDYYANYAIAATNPSKVALGKQLFFDPSLSASGTISCGTCHQPSRYFTDGQAKASNFVHGGSLQRNTPTLYYAALQSQQFYDLRSTTLEDQANEVMNSHNEFNLSSNAIAQKLASKPVYAQQFKNAFTGKTVFGGFEVRNAIAAYVRSLSPFTTAFDRYMAGDKAAMTTEAVQGFNLFAGKAKCATCHFMPLFNGNIPPWYAKSESEIIGVPQQPLWQNAIIDADSGRYAINRLDALLFAFKTPTVRNVAKTAPYMHNGVYSSLQQVVTFYQKGGGAGIGIPLPTQTLPFDSLQLNEAEKQALIAFMEALTDKQDY